MSIKRIKNKTAITLVELIIASAFVGVIILAAFSIDTTARRFYVSSERKAEVTNEAMFIMDHIKKSMTKAITYVSGGTILPGFDISNPTVLYVFIADETTSNPADGNIFHYHKHPLSGTYGFDFCSGTATEPLSVRVTNFSFANALDANGNIKGATITITVRYNPANAVNARTNPEVTLNSTFFPEQASF